MRKKLLLSNILTFSLMLSLSGCENLNDLLAQVTDTKSPRSRLNSPQPSARPTASAKPAEAAKPEAGPSVAPSATPAPAVVNDTSPKPVSLVLTPLPVSLSLQAAPLALKAEVEMSKGPRTSGVNWVVDDPALARIEDGKLHPLKAGKVKLTASAQDDPAIHKILYLSIVEQAVSHLALVPASTPSTSPSGSASPKASASPTVPQQLIQAVAGDITDIDSFGSRVFVTETSTNNLFVFDTTTNNVLKKVNVSSNPRAVDVSPDGSKIYVASGGATAIDVIDAATLEKTESISVDYKATDVVSSNDRLYVSGSGFDVPIMIDLATKQKIAAFPKGVYGDILEITPDFKTVYVGEPGSSPASLWKVDVTQNPPVLVIEDEHGAIGSNMRDFTLSPDGSLVYIACGAPYHIQILNTTDFKAAGQLDTGAYPESVSLTPDGKYAFATFAQKELRIFDTATKTLVTKKLFPYTINKAHVTADGKNVFGTQEKSFETVILSNLYDSNALTKLTTPSPSPSTL